MEKVAEFKEFTIFKLTKELAEKYIDSIINVLDSIPQVDKHNSEQVLADQKEDRIYHKKWEHSLLALDQNNEFAGIIMGYEREKENNEQYPQNTIYLSELAVNRTFQNQGLGKFLIQTWLEYNKKLGFLELEGSLRFAVQTNKDKWNKHVQKLYEFFGFTKISEKSYGNRIDNVYALNP